MGKDYRRDNCSQTVSHQFIVAESVIAIFILFLVKHRRVNYELGDEYIPQFEGINV